jgi:hypothetical protein
MSRRLLGLAVLALIPLGIQPSSAAFTATSTNTPSTFTTAADFNTVTVDLTDPGSPRSGTIALSATATSDRGIARVTFQHAPAGGSTWTDACVATSAPYTCDWNSAGVQGTFDVRAVARDTAGYERTAVRANRVVDSAGPALTFAPATNLSGTVTLNVTASDAVSGLKANSIVIEYRPSGGSWVELCRRSTSPASCQWATSGNGDYDLRASATDARDNVTTVTRADRHVDNTPPTASVTQQPAPVQRGTVTMTIDATDAGGVSKVVFEARPQGTTTWYPVCEDAQAPFTCSANPADFSAPDGDYDIRGVTYDLAGNATPSAVVSFRLDNTAPRGTDIQGLNGGVAGTLDANDRFTFTYSEPVLPGTIAAGWDGLAPLTVTVRVSAADNLTVWNAGNATQLGLATGLELNRDVTAAGAVLAGTLARSGNAYVLTLGTLSSGAVTTAPAASGTLRWTPSAAATDVAGNPAAATVAVETGIGDADL